MSDTPSTHPIDDGVQVHDVSEHRRQPVKFHVLSSMLERLTAKGANADQKKRTIWHVRIDGANNEPWLTSETYPDEDTADESLADMKVALLRTLIVDPAVVAQLDVTTQVEAEDLLRKLLRS